jgi:hypothetical protein
MRSRTGCSEHQALVWCQALERVLTPRLAQSEALRPQCVVDVTDRRASPCAAGVQDGKMHPSASARTLEHLILRIASSV